ncbi:hypothetical protein FQA47_010112 [Oryzias melastigma]|uniref:Uncharacterized protein n=1 Tax=Oryzias melastigma TaxID=30732 RepID=A0A834KWY4_ORYME|nr:hypothetical protein FQA47_010112 [Oryzias melastigma]
MSGSSVPGGTRGSSSFLSSQAAFWLAWFSTCFTHDADKLCAPAGLTLLSALLLLLSCFLFSWALLQLFWMLSAAFCAAFLYSCVGTQKHILVIYSCKRATRQRRMKFGPDMESLLGGSGISAEHTGVSNQQKKPSSNISDQTKVFTNVLDCIRQYSTFPVKMKNIQKRTEMGQYMDVRIHPAKVRNDLICTNTLVGFLMNISRLSKSLLKKR